LVEITKNTISLVALGHHTLGIEGEFWEKYVLVYIVDTYPCRKRSRRGGKETKLLAKGFIGITLTR